MVSEVKICPEALSKSRPTTSSNNNNNDNKTQQNLSSQSITYTPLLTRYQICFGGLLILTVGFIMGLGVTKLGSYDTSYVIQRQPKSPIKEYTEVSTTRPVINIKKPKVFIELPEKYLKYVKMNPPVNVFSLFPHKTAVQTKANEKPYFTVFLIKTAASLVKRRFLVRQTWGSIESINGDRFAIVFLVGLAKSPREQELLKQENDEYGDILQGDIPDTYRALPLKTLMGHQWIAQYFMNSTRLVTLTDDDCFINVVNMYDYFTHLPHGKNEEAVHCGFVYDNRGEPIRRKTSKWYISEENYSEPMYPIFCHGGMVVMNPHISADIYRVSLVTNYTGMHLEDVLSTGILRYKLKENGYGSEKVYSMYYVNRNVNKMERLVWHLANRETLHEQFEKLWIESQERFHEFPNNMNDDSNILSFNVTIKNFITKPGYDKMSLVFKS